MILKLRAVLGDDFVASYQGCHGAGSFSGPRPGHKTGPRRNGPKMTILAHFLPFLGHRLSAVLAHCEMANYWPKIDLGDP